MSENKLNETKVNITNQQSDGITDYLSDIKTHSNNINYNTNFSNMTYKINEYCENKISHHELEHDPDINFFNNLKYPNSPYLDIENINSSLTNLNYNLPFNVIHINCCSIFNKMDEINLLLSVIKTKVLAVTETWLVPEIAELISIQGFNFEHKARPNSSKGGGRVFYRL